MTQELKNDNVIVIVDRKPGCKVQLEVTVTPKASIEAHKKAIKSVNKEVSLPGFRKGKAPETLIVQHYNTYVADEWKQNVVQTAYSEAIKLTEIYPLNDKSIKKPTIKNISKDENSHIVIEFESQPNVPQVNMDALVLKKEEAKQVSDEDVQDFLEELRWHFAEFEDVTDRAVEEKDSVNVDIENLDKPGTFICKDTQFKAINGKMGDWMYNNILGKNIGESFEATSEKSPKAPKDVEFVPTHCKVTVLSIKKATLPEIDDKLATSMGAKDIEDLKVKARLNLESQANETVQESYREQCENLILEQYPFDLPHSMVQSELKVHQDAMRHQLEHEGKSPAEMSDELKNKEEQILKNVDRSLRMFFLSRNIAKDNGINVNNNELLEAIMHEMYGSSQGVDPNFNIDEARSRKYFELLTKKVNDLLVAKAKFE